MVLILSGGWLSSSAFALCVSSYQTRLRSEPSAKAKITWVVGRYMPLVQVDRKGAWIKVKDVDGEHHWVLASEVTDRVRCVVVKDRTAQLRKGPSAQQPLADIPSVDRYTAFKRLEADPEYWYWIEDETGNRYWVLARQTWRAATVTHLGF